MLSSAVRVKCRFCGNSFLARPELAVCQKCGRPANRALEIQWRIISFLVPFIGIGNALLIRPHSPVASNQGFVTSIVGVIAYGLIYYSVKMR